jgi:hypothetical protein
MIPVSSWYTPIYHRVKGCDLNTWMVIMMMGNTPQYIKKIVKHLNDKKDRSSTETAWLGVFNSLITLADSMHAVHKNLDNVEGVSKPVARMLADELVQHNNYCPHRVDDIVAWIKVLSESIV